MSARPAPVGAGTARTFQNAVTRAIAEPKDHVIGRISGGSEAGKPAFSRLFRVPATCLPITMKGPQRGPFGL